MTVDSVIFSGKVIGARRAMGDYSAIVKVQETDIWAEDEYGKTIADGVAGIDDAEIIRETLAWLSAKKDKKCILLGSFTINTYVSVDGLDVGIPITDNGIELNIIGEVKQGVNMDALIYIGNKDHQVFNAKVRGGILKGLKDPTLRNIWEENEALNGLPGQIDPLPDVEYGTNTKGNGIVVAGAKECIIENVKICEFAQSGLVIGCCEVRCENNYFNNIFVRGSGCNNSLVGQEPGGVEIYRPDQNIVNLIAWWSKKHGIVINGVAYNQWTYEAMMNIHAYGNEVDGIYLLNAQRLSLQNIYIEWNGRYGLHFVGDSKFNMFSNLYVWSNSQLTGEGIGVKFSQEHPGWAADNYILSGFIDDGVSEYGRGGPEYPNVINAIVNGKCEIYPSTASVSNIQVAWKGYRYNTQWGVKTLSGDGVTKVFKIGNVDLVPDITDPSKVVVSCTPASVDAQNASPVVGFVRDDDGDGKYESIYVKFMNPPVAGTNNVVIAYELKYYG